MKQYLKPKKNKIGRFFTTITAHLSAFAYPENFMFCRKYPFMKLTNTWDGSFLGYQFTWYDEIPKGWRVAFGQQLLDEIVDALKQDGIPKYKWRKAVRWEQIKEKYGTLRLYCSTTEKIQHILSKYEYMSMGYCIDCGAPAKYSTSGWITYLCEACYNRYCANCGDLPRAADRLQQSDIPQVIRCTAEGDQTVNLKDEYGVDLLSLWE